MPQDLGDNAASLEAGLTPGRQECERGLVGRGVKVLADDAQLGIPGASDIAARAGLPMPWSALARMALVGNEGNRYAHCHAP